ncbi:helix-turn-helix domain-containing protein [Paenibacillus sp. OVF10]|nr:helix-turn-helix domain-containing protein [Paenibacillus sp. OVF10]
MNQKLTALIDARKKNNWTQDQLAEKAGISRAYLANIERGEYSPSLKVAQRLSQLLGLSIDALFLTK